jgi:HlyD family secretion protein
VIKRAVTVGVILVALGIGAAAYYMRGGEARPEIVTASVTRGDVTEAVSATGTLEAVTTVQVGTQVSGTIAQLHADYNSIVRKGQVVARLDPSLFQTQIDQAEANLARAEADMERLKVAVDDAQTKLTRARELSARSLIPASELETADVNVRSAQAQLRSAQAQVTQARANLNQARVNLQHTVIQAPIDGIVISRNVDVGQTVAASMQAPVLFVIAADLTKMKVNANIDEADVGRIRPGQRVSFRVDAFPTEAFEGTVSQIRLQPTVVQNVVTYATVIDVPNGELKLKPGMTANVSLQIARRDDVLRVPNMALRFRPTSDIFAALGQEPPQEGLAGDPRPRGTSGDVASVAADTQGPAPGQPPASANDPERRRRIMERLENLPSEERERALQRLREREAGERPDAGAGVPPGSGGAARQSSAARPAQTTRSPAPAGGAQTIDALFGPLPMTETSGRVWRFVDGRLMPVRVRLGVTDGTQTELVAGELADGTPLVTGVLLQAAPSATQGGARSPLMGPQRPGGPSGGQRSR